MPALADKLEAAQAKRLAARHNLNSIVFNKASGEIIDLLETIDNVARKLDKFDEYQQAYKADGNPIDNIVAFLRRVL